MPSVMKPTTDATDSRADRPKLKLRSRMKRMFEPSKKPVRTPFGTAFGRARRTQMATSQRVSV